MSDINTITSVEQDGRTLSGVGASADALEAVMDRHAPESAETPALGTDAAPASEPTGSTTPAPEPQTRGRQRFSDLTRERDAARTETAAERTKREAAEQRIAALEQQLQQATTPAQQQHAQQQLNREVQQQQQQPARFTFPKYEDFIAIAGNEDVTYDDWQDRKDEARWQFRQSSQPPIQALVSQTLDSERAARTLQETIATTRATARQTYADFDQVLASGPGAQIPLGATVDSARARATYVIQHPASPHLQYAIMKDGELAKSLAQMNDIDFGLKLASLVPQQAPAHRQAPTPPPVPYQPVGSGSPTQAVPSSELAKKGFDFDKSGYREKRAAERGIKRVR